MAVGPGSGSRALRVREAVAEMGLDAEVEKATEFADIMSYAIISTAGLVVNGEVRGSGSAHSLRAESEPRKLVLLQPPRVRAREVGVLRQ